MMKNKNIFKILITIVIIILLVITIVILKNVTKHEKVADNEEKIEKMSEMRCEIGTYKNNSDTTFSQNVSGIDGNTAIQINAPQKEYAGFTYSYKNLNPRDFYSISAYVKVNSIDLPNSNDERGVNIMRYGTPASSETIKQVTTTWKKITLVAISDADGDLDICFRLNEGSGNVLFDKIEIKQINNDSNFKLYTYTNSEGKIGRIVFYKSNVDGTGITEDEIKKWLENLLSIRKYLTDFTGRGFDNGNVDIIATNYYPATAYVKPWSGANYNEIQWMKATVDLAQLHRNFQNGVDTPFFMTHEMGHQHTSAQSNFDSEYWASMLAWIADYNLNLKISGLGGNEVIKQGDEIIQYCYDGEYGYKNNFLKSKYAGDALAYITFQTILKLNSYKTNLGWESLQNTLKYTNNIEDTGTSGDKFIKFILKWSEYSGYDVKSLFYSNSSNDKNIIENELKIGKYDYKINSDGSTITVNGYNGGWELFNNETLNIPNSIDGYTVTNIGEYAFYKYANLTDVSIPSTVKAIGNCAFEECNNLTSVTIQEGIPNIGDWTFAGCSKLKDIKIPNSVTSIGNNSFARCNKSNLTIIGKTSSYAQTYANNNNIKFEATDKISVTSVTLPKANIILKVGQTDNLPATVSPSNATNKAVTYTSSNSQIVSVSNTGTITANKVGGPVTITATTEDGGKQATCTVFVEAPKISVISVSFPKTNIILEIGKTEVLTATVLPNNATNKEVTYSSSNSQIVSVSNTGIITANKVGGPVTITAITKDGGKQVTCTVFVEEPKVVMGDLNGDGESNITDLVIIRRHIQKIEQIKKENIKAADINKDNKIDITDLVKIRRHIQKIELIK